MTTRSRVGNSREAILEILRRHDGRSVDDLATALGLAGATVRRHLDVLLRDGHVSVSQVRGKTGRPRYVFSLTEAGAELFGHHYVRITRRLLQEIAALTAEETAGRQGEEIAELVFAKLSERLGAEYAPRVRGSTIEERTRAVAALLEEEGFEFEISGEDGDLRLLGRGCPCRRLRGGLEGAGCGHDRELLATLIGSRVEADRDSDLPADFVCAYLVHAD